MNFVLLSPEQLSIVEPWFDDPDSRRFLGGPEEVAGDIELMRTTPGTVFRGHLVLSNHVWIVYEEEQAVGYLGVECYDNGTAGFSFLVAPSVRRRGIGVRILSELDRIDVLRETHTYIGGISPSNTASRRCLEKAGFCVGDRPDHEGMLPIEKKRTL